MSFKIELQLSLSLPHFFLLFSRFLKNVEYFLLFVYNT